MFEGTQATHSLTLQQLAVAGRSASIFSSPPPPPFSSSSKFRTERLWKDYFRDPSLWWDRRSSKTNPNAPDFRHKFNRESLWLDAWDNPSWVHQMLRGREIIREASLEEGLLKVEDAYGNIIKESSLKEKLPKAEKKVHSNIRVDVYHITKEASLKEGLPKAKDKVYGNIRVPVYDNSIKEDSLKEGPPKAEKETYVNTSRESKLYDSASIVGGNGSDWEKISLEEALSSLENGSRPPLSIQKIYSLLYKCTKESNLACASRLHAYVCERGLETNTLLGNQLVLMLIEAGNMLDAQQVFDGLLHRRKRSWNFLITGYVGRGKPRHALGLYQRMQEEGSVHPDPFTFVSLMKACAETKDLESGRKLHDHILRTKLLEKDGVVGNALVNMYFKFKLLSKAQEVFDELPLKNVISWNTLITGYTKYGHGELALKCFEQMRQEGISPNSVTYICSMKACGSVGDMCTGLELHSEIAREGLLETDLHVGSALVDMYAKAGSLLKAQEVFDTLPTKNIVSWNALIAGYVQCECYVEALKCFDRLRLEGIPPDAVTYISCLKACGSIGAVDQGGEIHDWVVRNGLLQKDPVIGSALVNMYAKCGLFAKAQEVFDKIPTRDVISWTALIAGYAEHGQGEEALDCFEQMQVEGICPNAITYVCSLKACGSIAALHEGQEMYAEIARKGLLKSDPIVGSTLVDMYAKCGLLSKAQEVFDKIPTRNVISWNALITGYVEFGCGKEALLCFERMQLEGALPDAVTYVCSLKACSSIGDAGKGHRLHSQIVREGLLGGYLAAGNALVDMYTKCGLLTKAQEVFDELPARDIVSWNALLAGYAQNEYGEEALNCLEQMQSEGLSPDVITYVSSLKACGIVGATVKGQEIHAEIAKDEVLKRDSAIGNALVDMYAKCGLLQMAQGAFDNLLVRDTVSWTSLIAGYAQLGESKIVFDVFERMLREGAEPNLVTFVGVLNACSHAGLVEEGQMNFVTMCKIYDIVPISEHHTCMVDLLCRAGQLELAVSMIKRMLFLPDLVVWHTVLGACQKWSNVELGRHAFEHAMQLDEFNTAAYISMSNIYAHAGMQKAAKKIKALRIERSSTKKKEHCWWANSNGIVHPFWVSRENYYPSRDMYVMREDVSCKATEEGLQQGCREASRDATEGLCKHSEKLAVACALVNTPNRTPIHIVKNTRVCNDCHAALELVSKVEDRRILCKDAMRFHEFEKGKCTCTNN